MANPYSEALLDTVTSTGITGMMMRDFVNNAQPTSQEDALSKIDEFVTNPSMAGFVRNEISKPSYNLSGLLATAEAQKPENRAATRQANALSEAGFSPTPLWNLPDNVEAAAYYVNPAQFDAKELPYNMVGVGATNYGVDLDNVTDRFQNIWETYGQYAEGVKPWSESPIPESEAKMGGNKSIWNGMKDFLGPQGGGSRGRYGPEAAAAYENYLKTGQISDALPVGFAFDAFDYGGRYTGNKFQNKKGSIFDRFVAPALTIGASIINPYLGAATAATIGGIQGKPIGDIALDAAQAGAAGAGAGIVRGAGGFANLSPGQIAKLTALTAGNTLATGLRTDFDPALTGLTAATTSGGLSSAAGALGDVLPDAITDIPGNIGDALGNPIQGIRDALPDFMTGASNLPSNIPEGAFDLEGALTSQIPDPLFPNGIPLETNSGYYLPNWRNASNQLVDNPLVNLNNSYIANTLSPDDVNYFDTSPNVNRGLFNDNFVAAENNPFDYVGTNAVTGFDVPNPVPGFSSVVAPTVDIPASTTSLSPTAPGQGFVSPDYSLPILTPEEQLTNSLFPEGSTADTTLQNNINPFLRSDSFITPEIPDPAVDTLFGEGQFNVNNPFADQPNYIDEFTLEPDSILDKIKDNPFEATKLALGAASEFFPDETATATAGASGNPFQMPQAPAVTGRPRMPYELGFTPMEFTPINYRSFYNPFMGV